MYLNVTSDLGVDENTEGLLNALLGHRRGWPWQAGVWPWGQVGSPAWPGHAPALHSPEQSGWQRPRLTHGQDGAFETAFPSKETLGPRYVESGAHPVLSGLTSSLAPPSLRPAWASLWPTDCASLYLGCGPADMGSAALCG